MSVLDKANNIFSFGNAIYHIASTVKTMVIMVINDYGKQIDYGMYIIILILQYHIENSIVSHLQLTFIYFFTFALYYFN